MKKNKTLITSENRRFILAAKMLGFIPLGLDKDVPDDEYLDGCQFCEQDRDLIIEVMEHTVPGLIDAIYEAGIEDGKQTRTDQIIGAFRGIVDLKQ